PVPIPAASPAVRHTKKSCSIRFSLLQFLSHVSHEKQGDGSRTGMGSNGRADLIDQKILSSKTFFYKLLHVIRVFRAVSVADEDTVVFIAPASHLLFHHVHQRLKGFLPPSHLSHRGQMALLIHMQKGLDSGKGSHDRRGFAHSSASVQMEQVVHRKDMHQVLLMRFHPLRCLIQALSRFFQLYRLMYQ